MPCCEKNQAVPWKGPCGNERKLRVAISDKIVISDKIDFKTRVLYNDDESIQEEDITVVNIYAPNIEALKYIK